MLAFVCVLRYRHHKRCSCNAYTAYFVPRSAKTFAKLHPYTVGAHPCVRPIYENIDPNFIL